MVAYLCPTDTAHGYEKKITGYHSHLRAYENNPLHHSIFYIYSQSQISQRTFWRTSQALRSDNENWLSLSLAKEEIWKETKVYTGQDIFCSFNMHATR